MTNRSVSESSLEILRTIILHDGGKGSEDYDAAILFEYRQKALDIIERACGQDGMLEWAVGRWKAEVENRPLVNVHRRTLDDTWRQVIRYAGGNPIELVGTDHDTRLALNPVKPAWEQDNVGELVAALEGILAITDRKHVAWDKAHAAINKYRDAHPSPIEGEIQ